MEAVASLPTLEALRQHVHAILCQHDHLDPEQTPMLEWVMTRASRPCGISFEVQGPRRVRTSAVWAGDENRILFYDSQGRRFAETRLSEGPDPHRIAKPA